MQGNVDQEDSDLLIRPKRKFRDLFQRGIEAEPLAAINLLCTACLVISTIIYTAFAGCQWHEMKTGSSDTHALAIASRDQANAAGQQASSMGNLAQQALDQARATNELARQAKRSADAALDTSRAALLRATSSKQMAGTSDASLKVSKDALKLEERAWLGVTGITLSRYQPGKTIEGSATYFNSGKTPAVKVTTDIEILIDMPNKVPTFPYDWMLDWKGHQPVTPNSSQWLKRELPRLLLTEQIKDELNRHYRLIWVYGVLRYEDIFGETHRTEFCGYSVGIDSITENVQLAFCPDHNQTD